MISPKKPSSNHTLKFFETMKNTLVFSYDKRTILYDEPVNVDGLFVACVATDKEGRIIDQVVKEGGWLPYKSETSFQDAENFRVKQL